MLIGPSLKMAELSMSCPEITSKKQANNSPVISKTRAFLSPAQAINKQLVNGKSERI